MKAIITGMSGTVAPVVANLFKANGYEIVAYDRYITPIDDKVAIEAFIKKENPRIVLHLALGSQTWSSMLAEITKSLDIAFVYISTVSVFGNNQKGPFVVSDAPMPSDDYGKYKKASEDVVLKANPNSYIIRIGWQIGDAAGSNNMIDFFQKQMDESGFIKASSNFYPSCSFMPDTASAIYDIITNHQPGLYLVNSNHTYSLYEIATFLKTLHPLFKIEEDLTFKYDNRMFDARVDVKRLNAYF